MATFSQNQKTGAGHAVLPLFALVVLYAGAAALVNPHGEFPLNDDWSYTRSAFRLASGEGIHVDEWAAPSLVGQTLYGGALAATFGRSFTVLRLSTIALSCAFAIMLWLTLSALEVRRELTGIAVLSWIFNPVQFCLAYSFMTEVPFLFFVGLGTLLFVRHLRSGSRLTLVACAAAFGYAFTIRQLAVLFIGPLVLCVIPPGRDGRWKQSLQNAAIVLLVCSAFVTAYEILVAGSGGTTPATRRKYELLHQITFDQIAGNSLGILFYISFMLLPLAVALGPLLWRSTGGGARITAVLFWALVSAAGVAWFYWRYASPFYLPGRAFHPRMPYLLNILWDTGLGPVTLDPSYYGSPATPVYPRVWMAVTALTAAALIPVGMLITAALLQAGTLLRRASVRARVGGFAVMSFFSVAIFEVLFSHLQEGGLFDRHILTAAFPVVLAMAAIPALRSSDAAKPMRATGTISLVIVAALAWFCVAGTHDYLAWNRVRWELGTEILSTGVDPLDVSFGFEFNGWYNYDKFRARGNIEKVYYWWHDRQDYLITMAPQEGYHTLKTGSYSSWLHRCHVILYLLAKDET